jgi:GGDEF domain-containing protein
MVKAKTKTVTSSLNVRLINLMVIFALVITASFTAIQVHNQMRNATDQNLYRSNLSSIIIHQSIDQTVNQALRSEKNKKELIGDFQSALNSLIESGVSNEIYIVDNNENVVAQSTADGEPITPSLQDLERIKNIIDLNAHDSWSYPYIDREANTMDTLMPIAVDDRVAYVLKTAYSLGGLQDALKAVYIPILITVGLVIFLSVANTLALSKKIVKPIKTLNEASKEIAGGNLSLQVRVKTNDEIEELSQTFNVMTRELARMKDIAENANPLTKLPGNNIIHEEIDERIEQKKKFIVIHSDLDNFKVFNDAYGIGAGDIAIRLTSELFKESIHKFGAADNFVGHEGGDDFVLISTPETIKPLTDYFLSEFDKRSRKLYSKEDQERGFILGKERRAEGTGREAKPQESAKFPLMSISLAALSNEDHPFESYADITNRMVEIKKKAKRTKGSCLVMVKI